MTDTLTNDQFNRIVSNARERHPHVTPQPWIIPDSGNIDGKHAIIGIEGGYDGVMVAYAEKANGTIIIENQYDAVTLVSANDLQLALIEASARITALEAELAAVRNPPYRIVMSSWDNGIRFHSGDLIDDYGYAACVMRGDEQLFSSEVCDSEADARAEAQAFIDKLAK